VRGKASKATLGAGVGVSGMGVAIDSAAAGSGLAADPHATSATAARSPIETRIAVIAVERCIRANLPVFQKKKPDLAG
jgi:hypothetical protein